jgi:predicted nuclease of predicted toxin-antitoxin system
VKLLLDMNLSPALVEVLESAGWEALHWQSVGDTRAADAAIMGWAHANGYCVVTNDLDFTAILAATRAAAPSVIQIRGQDLAPARLAPVLIPALRRCEQHLEHGAVLCVDHRGQRLRLLPLPG